MDIKRREDAGADNRTPSVPQYFSWINNTNEGSTYEHTMINLEFFEWMKETYGMEIKIYAWDAGNFDGAGNGYGDEDGARFKEQYPEGYGPIVEKAASLGIRLGLWGGPDGYGNTPEEEKKRYDFIVNLCKKYNFALFKIDGVCGKLRKEKAETYAKMLQECRKYSPDLIVLNHRLELFGAEKYVTTYLWNGVETYVDVFSRNQTTCMHHRGFLFTRGFTEGLDRMVEDHGVCISSAISYFEDDLIYQAFGRALILAPEIYGNPWLMHDDEFPKLARVYNIHKHCAPILVDGMVLPDVCGASTISRGTDTHRFLTTGNNTWEKQKLVLSLDETIGLNTKEKIKLIQRHPTEKVIGTFEFGSKVEVELMPFRAHLFEIAVPEEALPALEDCEYQVIREDADGNPVEVKVITAENAEWPPVLLGTLSEDAEALPRGEELFETACFGVDNDSLEIRELRKSGATKVPQVQAARDAFFSQETYIKRGCEGSAVFDGREDTFYDSCSKFLFYGSFRVDGGCLRVDFGDVYDADSVEITCFAIDEAILEVPEQSFTEHGGFSKDMKTWKNSGTVELSIEKEEFYAPVVLHRIHFIEEKKGKLFKATYPVEALRYFRLPCPMDRIYSVRLMKNGQEIKLENPTINNLLPSYKTRKVRKVLSATVQIPRVKDGDYISVAINGEHGIESAYCVAEYDGALHVFPDRACSYPSNVWDFYVDSADSNYTYYLPLEASMSGKEIKIYTTLSDPQKLDVKCDVYLCPRH